MSNDISLNIWQDDFNPLLTQQARHDLVKERAAQRKAELQRKKQREAELAKREAEYRLRQQQEQRNMEEAVDALRTQMRAEVDQRVDEEIALARRRHAGNSRIRTPHGSQRPVVPAMPKLHPRPPTDELDALAALPTSVVAEHAQSEEVIREIRRRALQEAFYEAESAARSIRRRYLKQGMNAFISNRDLAHAQLSTAEAYCRKQYLLRVMNGWLRFVDDKKAAREAGRRAQEEALRDQKLRELLKRRDARIMRVAMRAWAAWAVRSASKKRENKELDRLDALIAAAAVVVSSEAPAPQKQIEQRPPPIRQRAPTRSSSAAQSPREPASLPFTENRPRVSVPSVRREQGVSVQEQLRKAEQQRETERQRRLQKEAQRKRQLELQERDKEFSAWCEAEARYTAQQLEKEERTGRILRIQLERRRAQKLRRRLIIRHYGLNPWLQYIRICRAQITLAARWYNQTLSRSALWKWHQFAAASRQAKEQRLVDIEQEIRRMSELYLLRRVMATWAGRVTDQNSKRERCRVFHQRIVLVDAVRFLRMLARSVSEKLKRQEIVDAERASSARNHLIRKSVLRVWRSNALYQKREREAKQRLQNLVTRAQAVARTHEENTPQKAAQTTTDIDALVTQLCADIDFGSLIS